MNRALKTVGALLIIGVGVVHLEQYYDFMIKDVPTVGTLFLLNSFGAGAICVMLAGPFTLLPALAGIGLSLGSLVSIFLARYADSGIFNFREPTWRAPIVVAVALEIVAIVVLGLLAARRKVA